MNDFRLGGLGMFCGDVSVLVILKILMLDNFRITEKIPLLVFIGIDLFLVFERILKIYHI